MTKVKILTGSNYTRRTLLRSELSKEGDRAIDQITVDLPKNETVGINDKLYYVQDFVEVDDLSLLLNFQLNVKDESGTFNHGSATAITYEDEDDFYGKQASFNGSTSFVSIPDNNNLDLSGVFDIFIWAKWSSTAEQYLLSKRSSTSNGWAISVNKTTAGSVTFKIGSTNIVSSSAGFNDGEKHLIRVTRDSDNLITLYVDNVSKGTATVNTNLTDANALLIGKDFGGSFLSGKILRFRLYKGATIQDEKATIIYSKKNPRSTIKFGGRITKINVGLASQQVIAQSFGKVLAEVNVRGNEYTDKTPEYILNDLVTTSTDLSFTARQSTGLTLDKYLSDGKLVDVLRDFSFFTNFMFYTTPLEEVFFEPLEFTAIENIQFEHGNEVLVEQSGYDDAKVINSVTLIGETLAYWTRENFDGNGSNKVFSLQYSGTSIQVMAGGNDTTDTHSANGAENTFKLSKKIEEGMLNTMTVTVAGTVKTAGTHYNVDTVGQKIVFTQGNFPPSGTNNVVITYSYDVLIAEEDYTVDSAGKNVTFTTAPVTGVNNVAIEYDYEIPMVIQGEKRSSIETYGKHSKTLTLSWVNNRTDGVRLVQSYLNRHKSVLQRTQLKFGTLINYIKENDVIRVKNSGLGIDSSFVVKNIKWSFPDMETVITVGEYYFDFFDHDVEISKKMHDFESALTRVKDVQDYESPEEVLALTDTVIQIISEDFSESLNLGDVVNKYDKSRATWGSSNYGSRKTQDVYGST
tara:strand:- start:996 stop:3230 length:2235 start_codon:yes stop_codon:yes gene_type:complete